MTWFKTSDHPRKWYRGKKRICRKHCLLAKPSLLKWALAVKPGDYIGTCSGFNAQVSEIEYHWKNVVAATPSTYRVLKHWALEDILFIDNTGRYHYLSGAGCVSPPDSIEDIVNGYREWISEENVQSGWVSQEWYDKIKYRFDNNLPIVDEHGALLLELRNQ